MELLPYNITLVHILLAIALFFLINWIGDHSYSVGYMQISLFVKTEEAPAFNFLIRTLTPVCYLIIISTILYTFKFDEFVVNIYLVSVYYILFRLIYNLITSRGLLMNWYRQSLYWITIISISYVAYEKLIKIKKNLLPDFATVANELWIIILLFLFQVANNIRLPQDGTIKRKNNYLDSKYTFFKSRFGSLISSITQNQVLEATAYGILIYEDFNRPQFVRWLENLRFQITNKPHTLGVMQVYSATKINDIESVKLGCEKIKTYYDKYVQDHQNDDFEYFSERYVYSDIAADYNSGFDYQYEVSTLINTIIEKHYPNTTDTLRPQKNTDSTNTP